jgi:hypothetical protein
MRLAGESVEVEPLFTLEPTEGVPVIVHRRSQGEDRDRAEEHARSEQELAAREHGGGQSQGSAPGSPPGGWTPRSLARRVRAVLREEGMRSLWMRALSESIYRRMLVLEGTLADPPPWLEPPEGVEFAPLQPGEIDEYLRLRPDQRRGELEARLASGHVCFAARDRGRLVQTCWFAPDAAWIEYLDWELPLAPGEAYVYDFYALPSARGRHLFRAQVSAMYAFFSDHDQRLRWFPDHAALPDARYGFVAAFHIENRVWSLFTRAGLRPREITGYIGLGALRRSFRRPAPSEKRLRRVARRRGLRQRRRSRKRSRPSAAEPASEPTGGGP